MFSNNLIKSQIFSILTNFTNFVTIYINQNVIFMDRRSFLKKSAVTATGFSLTPMIGKSYTSLVGQNAPSNKINVGVIGLRNHGWSNLRAFLNYPEVECVSLCDS